MTNVRERISESLARARAKNRAIVVLFLAALAATSLAVVTTRAAQQERAEADQARAALAEAFRSLGACLGEKEGPLWIGGELHLCRAVPTGVRR